jgi:hypothetical protein
MDSPSFFNTLTTDAVIRDGVQNLTQHQYCTVQDTCVQCGSLRYTSVGVKEGCCKYVLHTVLYAQAIGCGA